MNKDRNLILIGNGEPQLHTFESVSGTVDKVGGACEVAVREVAVREGAS